MNFQSQDPAQNQEQNSSISFRINRTNHGKNRSNTPPVEWARISPNKVIVATSEKAWLLEDTDENAPENSSTQYFTQSMEGAGSIETTRQLLDGAIAAAKYAINSDVRPPALTATRWVWRLAGLYHLTYHNPKLMNKAVQIFAVQKRFCLAQWAKQKVKEEIGHEKLALKDIKALGYVPEAVVKELVPPAAKVLIDYFARSVQDPDPIDSVGYTYAMERFALGIDKKHIQMVQELLMLDTSATKCLSVHSNVGADVEHVEETIQMIANLSAAERLRITRACYETALLCFTPSAENYITDKEIQQTLEPLKLQKSI